MAAESIVAQHYCQAGGEIAEQRWRGEGGEIDIIVKQGDDLVFVEVKQSKTFEGAAESLSAHQANRIMTAGAEYAGTRGAGLLTNMRFDVALVDGTGAIEVLPNAIGH